MYRFSQFANVAHDRLGEGGAKRPLLSGRATKLPPLSFATQAGMKMSKQVQFLSCNILK